MNDLCDTVQDRDVVTAFAVRAGNHPSATDSITNPVASPDVELLVSSRSLGGDLDRAAVAGRAGGAGGGAKNAVLQQPQADRAWHCTTTTLPMAFCRMASTCCIGDTPAPPIIGTWVSAILPELEQQNIFDLFNFTKLLADPVSEQGAVKTVVSVLVCPTDPASGTPLLGGRVQSYQNPPGSMGLWYPVSMGPTHNGDNASNSCVFCSQPPQPPPSYCCQGNDWAQTGRRAIS